jgi:hypothetical protein
MSCSCAPTGPGFALKKGAVPKGQPFSIFCGTKIIKNMLELEYGREKGKKQEKGKGKKGESRL